jgi:hypothetical protein
MRASRSTQLHIRQDLPSGSPADPEGPVALRPRITSGLPLSEDQLDIMSCESFAVNPASVREPEFPGRQPRCSDRWKAGARFRLSVSGFGCSGQAGRTQRTRWSRRGWRSSSVVDPRRRGRHRRSAGDDRRRARRAEARATFGRTLTNRGRASCRTRGCLRWSRRRARRRWRFRSHEAEDGQANCVR